TLTGNLRVCLTLVSPGFGTIIPYKLALCSSLMRFTACV
ncbi:MAG: hypothetical protein QOJ42_3523, partial [Acidobacteriaceae bacterium]|nr:hypothetical protein [Acidobacteriaceae bacterium]